MYCHVCGKEIAEGEEFCTNCGAKIRTGEGEYSQGSDPSADTNDASNVADSFSDVLALPPQKPKKRRTGWIVAVVILVVVIGIIVLLCSGDDNEAESENTSKGSAAEIYEWLADNDDLDYDIPEKAISFIENHPDFFPGNEENDGAMSDYVDDDADYAHVKKSPDKYADKFIMTGGTIVDCEEAETEYGTMTYLHIMDYEGCSYCMYYLDSIDLVEGDEVARAYVLPFGMTTFENLNATYTEAIVGAVGYIR